MDMTMKLSTEILIRSLLAVFLIGLCLSGLKVLEVSLSSPAAAVLGGAITLTTSLTISVLRFRYKRFLDFAHRR